VTFHLVPKDAEFLADEFGNEQLVAAQNLEPLSYIVCDRWGKISKSKIVFPKKAPHT
jgi:hypothetical protein